MPESEATHRVQSVFWTMNHYVFTIPPSQDKSTAEQRQDLNPDILISGPTLPIRITQHS